MLPKIKLLGFSIAFIAVHWIVNTLLLESNQLQNLFKYHAILAFLSLVIVFTAGLIKIKFPDKVGFFYLATILFKMAIVVLICFEFIRPKTDYTIVFLSHFFLIFFAYLIVEVVLVLKSI